MLNLKKPNEKKDSHKETNEKRLSFLENRIRDAERQLQNPRLDVSVKQDLERKLKSFTLQRNDLVQKERIKDMSEKYRPVKFYDKKKILKKMNQTEKKLKKTEPSSEEWTRLKQELVQYDEWLRYIQFYPLDMDYISILNQSLTDRDANTRNMILERLTTLHQQGGLHSKLTLLQKDLSEDLKEESSRKKVKLNDDDFFLE